jgi:hypothetical protein
LQLSEMSSEDTKKSLFRLVESRMQLQLSSGSILILVVAIRLAHESNESVRSDPEWNYSIARILGSCEAYGDTISLCGNLT